MIEKKKKKRTKKKAGIVETKGKKKRAIARVTLKKGTGKIRINRVPLEIVEPEVLREYIAEPLALAGETAKQVDISVNTTGGGLFGKASAIRTAIGSALVEHTKSESMRKMFSDYDRSMLVSDVRRKESKKYLRKGARARRQKSYR